MHGSTDQELEEVHCMVQSLRIVKPSTQSPPIPARNPARSPTAEAANPLHLSPTSNPPFTTSSRRLDTRISSSRSPHRSHSPPLPENLSHESNISMRVPSSPTETMSTSRATSPTQKRISDFSIGGSSLRYSSSSCASSMASSGGWSSPGTPLISNQPLTTAKRNLPLPKTPEVREPSEVSGEYALPLLPPSALGYTTSSERPISRSTLSQYPAIQPDIVKLHRSSTTSSQKAAFEKDAFRNSAVLCDV
jgi:hypothetical protein